MRFSIRSKYTLLIGSIILLLTMALYAYMHRQFNRISASYIASSSQFMGRAFERIIQRQGITISQILATSLVNPLYTYDQNSMRHLIDSYKSHPNVLGICVFDAEGRVLHDGTGDVREYGDRLDARPLVDRMLAEHKPVTQIHKGHMDIYHPIMLEDIPLGGVRVEMSLAEMRRSIEKSNAQLAAVLHTEHRRTHHRLYAAIAAVIGLSLILAHFLASRISIPILKMSRFATNIGQGNYDNPMQYSAKDEIGELIHAFNTMQSDLRRSTISISELETQVALRTRELAEVNQDLKLHQERLEQKIAARTAELVETNKCLTQEIEERKNIQEKLIRAKKMEAMGTLASGVAHDLNNILTGMVGIPDLVLMNLPQDSPVRNELLTIKKSGLRAAAVVQDLLNLARKNIVQNKPMELRAVLREYLSSPEHKEILRHHPQVCLHTEIPEREFPILGSRIHVIKTLMNLVSNAAEAMPQGGRISISLAMEPIDPAEKGFGEFAQGEHAVLRVGDLGEGIPPEILEHVFEPFYTTKTMGRSGSGLGLAVVRETMKDHKGHIHVQSVAGQGTTFALYFPAISGDSLKKAEGTSNDHYRGDGEQILIVDDLESQRQLLQSILTRLGYRAQSLPSGEAAIEYLKTHAADLLILDMIMSPGMDGLATYQEIIRFRPEQKAIMVSGYSEAARASELQSLGVCGYVRKPYTVKQIGRAVRMELDRRRQATGFPQPGAAAYS